MDGREGSGELSPGCWACWAGMAGGRGVAGDAGADDAEPGLWTRGESASAMVLGDHLALTCFLSADAGRRSYQWQSIFMKEIILQANATNGFPAHHFQQARKAIEMPTFLRFKRGALCSRAGREGRHRVGLSAQSARPGSLHNHSWLLIYNSLDLTHKAYGSRLCLVQEY